MFIIVTDLIPSIVIIHKNIALHYSVDLFSCINFPNGKVLKFLIENAINTGLSYKFLHYLQRLFCKMIAYNS